VTAAVEPAKRIWFLPHEYWQITKKMSAEEIDQLMHEVECLAEARNFAALSKYPFIFIGERCHRREERLASV
jgi:hypothetical protein